MDQEQFCYWLQGFFEVSNPTWIDEEETKVIRDHLATVFNKITPHYEFKQIADPLGHIDWRAYSNNTMPSC